MFEFLSEHQFLGRSGDLLDLLGGGLVHIWLMYRGSPSAIYLDQVTRNVSDLARAVRAFETEAK